MALAPWRVLARAEMTRKIAHGERYLETRVFLDDGRVMEQVNPGVPDLENDWKEVGRYTDLIGTLRALKREGWEVTAPERLSLRIRTLLVAVVIALGAPIAAYLALRAMPPF